MKKQGDQRQDSAFESESLQQWQRAEIAVGLAEAEKGDFASYAEVELVLGKYKNPPSQRRGY